MQRFTVLIVLLYLGTVSLANTNLSRRPMLGASLVPVDSAMQAEIELPFDNGVVVAFIQPGSTAEVGGMLAGDILLSINGSSISIPTEVGPRLKSIGSGNTATMELIRDSKRFTLKLTLQPVPLESSDEYDVIYDAVNVDGFGRRIVITKPLVNGKLPLIVVLGSMGCYSLDPPIGMMNPYAEIVNAMTLAGFVTLRVEKTGMGDSEGPPCAEQNFWDEVHGVTEALKVVRQFDYVDSNQVFLFGVSTGSIVAPLVAAGIPVRGIIGYGATANDWTEYELGNLRRQRILGGMEPDSVDIVGKIKVQVMHRLVWEGESSEQIIFDIPGSDVLLGYPVHTSYIRDLGRLNIPDYWKQYNGQALLIYGTSDFITQASDHEYICNIVNRYHPGHAQYLELDDIDYFLIQTADPQASFDNMVAGMPNLEFNRTLLDKIKTWCKRLLK